MQSVAASGPSTSSAGDGSRTMTITRDPTQEGDGSTSDGVVGTLRLRGQSTPGSPRVTWDEEVIDNEGMGKKKSKICCIFRKTRNFDESSSDSDSDSDSDDSSCRGHDHTHGRDGEGASGGSSSNQSRPAPSKVHECHSSEDDKNAYERLPSHMRKHKKGKRRADS